MAATLAPAAEAEAGAEAERARKGRAPGVHGEIHDLQDEGALWAGEPHFVVGRLSHEHNAEVNCHRDVRKADPAAQHGPALWVHPEGNQHVDAEGVRCTRQSEQHDPLSHLCPRRAHHDVRHDGDIPQARHGKEHKRDKGLRIHV